MKQGKPASSARRTTPDRPALADKYFNGSSRGSSVKFLSRFPIVIALALVLSLSIRMPAQPTPYVVGSTVTGTVFCADTNAPARFAKVVLKSIEPSHAGEDFMKNLQENLQKMAAKDGEGSEPVGPPSDDKRKALAA